MLGWAADQPAAPAWAARRRRRAARASAGSARVVSRAAMTSLNRQRGILGAR